MRTRFTRLLTRLATVTALSFVSSCLDPAALKLSDILGDWKLIHLNRTSASTGETIDAMQADTGSSLHMTVAADGSLTTVSVTNGGAPVNGTGSLTLSGANKLVLNGQAYFGNVFLQDGLLTVDCGEQLGIPEYSRIVFIFARP